MSLWVADCPRCGSQKITFDVLAQKYLKTEYGWQHWFEIYAVCRACHKGTIFIVSQKDLNQETKEMAEASSNIGLVVFRGALNGRFEYEGYISLRHEMIESPPEHLPPEILTIFDEGATCLAVQCWNAAATMFRLCLDLVTKPLLPETDPSLTENIRRNLGSRLKWLFANGKLPAALKDLSDSVREDGNDGAHAGNLKMEDAEDLHDFTRSLLERLYTEPERLKLAATRRAERRQPK